MFSFYSSYIDYWKNKSKCFGLKANAFINIHECLHLDFYNFCSFYMQLLVKVYCNEVSLYMAEIVK